MKPKYRRIAKTIPTLVTLVMSAVVANAAIITDNAAGNVTITSTVDVNNSGANSVNANGGTSATPFVTLQTGAVLTGSNAPATDYGVQTTGADYTITNNGSITVAGTDDGIRVNGGGGTVITNNGTITSDDGEGIEIAIDGVTVNNSVGALIRGGNDNNDNAVEAQDDFILNNSGTIETTTNNGNDAVNVDDDATITNLAGGNINGNEGGILADNDLTLTNSGTISSDNADGVDADDDATITNLAGGTITGDDDALDIEDRLILSNAGTITGLGSDGVEVEDDAEITNLVGGTITGDDDGIDAGEDLVLTNNGTIEGFTSNGIEAGLDADITNSSTGTIIGETDAVNLGDFGTISNAGTITSNNLNGVNAGTDLTLDNLAGGQITGLEGIITGDDLIVTNAGTITGNQFDGIDAENDATITNLSGGSITGGDEGVDAESDLVLDNQLGASILGLSGFGVEAEDDSVITNGGSITASIDDAIHVDENANVTNSGTITATTLGDGIFLTSGVVTNTGSIISNDDDGIDVDGTFGQSFTLTNSGLIQGLDKSVSGEDTDDTLNLNLGSRLVGDVYGYGGTDEINFDGGLTSFLDSASGASSNSILGDVIGFGEINKAGSGVAFIGVPGNGGFSVEADVINITGGGLYINADIIAEDGVSQSTINAGGAALGGTGTWDANIFVTAGGFSAGEIPINLDLDPTNAVGQVTVTGDVTHTAGSFIRHDIIPQGGGDDLILQTGIGNTYNLGGGTNIRMSSTDNNRVISDGVYTVVDSQEPIAGSLGTLSIQYNDNVNNNDTGFQGSEIFNGSSVTTTVLTNFFTDAVINGSNVELIVQHDYENLPGFSDNQSSIGAALDASTNSPDPVIQDFIAALDNSSLAFVDAVLTDLTSLDSFSTAVAITSSNNHLNSVVRDHLAMTRTQTGTISRTYVGSYAEPMTQVSEQAPALGNRFNVWGSFSYDWKDSSGFNTDIDGEEASFLAGIDYRIAPRFLLGVLLQGSTADYDFNGGESDVDSFRAAIYGTYGEATGFYADFLVGYGDHDFDSSRNIGFGSFDTDTDAESIQAMLTVGYAMQSGSVKHGPWGGVEYSKVDVDGYNQGGLLPIGVDDYDVESTRLLIGYRLEAQAGRFTPYASVSYAYELEDDNQGTNGTLPGGATFGIDGGQLDSAFLISVGTGYSLTDSLGLNVGYQGEISTGDGIDSHGGTIGLNYAF